MTQESGEKKDAMNQEMARAFVFLGIALLHWTLQFIAWSLAEGSTLMRIVWGVLSTPLVPLCGALANQYFWIIATANSLLWAAILTFVVFRYVLKHPVG